METNQDCKTVVEDDDCDGNESSRGSIESSNSVGSEKEFTGQASAPTGKKFLDLPPPPPAALPVNCTKGWASYLTSRWPGDAGILQRVQTDPITLDGLTYPVTLAFLLASLKYLINGELTILILGAMARVEERLLRETTYWGEVAVCLRARVHLVLCGPEVSETRMCSDPGGSGIPPPNSDTRASLFNGTFREYMDKHQPCKSSTVVVAYNAGFGNFTELEKELDRAGMVLSWIPDLREILASNLPAFFTQANAEVDLKGEVALMAHVLGARFVVLPTQNPFAAATRLAPEALAATSCANLSFYGVQGHDEERMMGLNADVSTPAGRSEVVEAIKAAAGRGTDLPALEAMTARLVMHQVPADARPPPSCEVTQRPQPLLNCTNEASRVDPDTSTDRLRPAKAARMAPEQKILVESGMPMEESPRHSLPAESRSAEALMSAATIWSECGALKSESTEASETREFPVPNYRLEVSPKDGVIRATVSLPLLESAQAVDLEVYRGELLVAVEGVYSELKVRLPSPVDEESVIAKFDRRRRELDLTLHERKTACGTSSLLQGV